MKKGYRFVFFNCFLMLIACQGNQTALEEQLKNGIQSCDSIQALANEKLPQFEVSDLVNRSKQQFLLLKMDLNDDTLNVVQAQKIDAFVTAYKNAVHLDRDWKNCLQANLSSKQRQQALLQDIQSHAGNKSVYASDVQFEQKEMKRIQKNIQQLIELNEKLKATQAALEPILSEFYP